MKLFERLELWVRTVFRRRRHSLLPKPTPKQVPEEISTVQIDLPPTNNDTKTSETVLEPKFRAAVDEEQSQLLPPITRSSESVWEAPIGIPTDEEPIRGSPQKLQLSIQPSIQTISVDRLSPGGWSSRSSRGTSISSHASTSRDSSRSKASIAGNSLNSKLRRKRRECHQRAQSFFIPVCDQKSLITVPNIEKDIQDGVNFLEPTEIRKIAEEAFVVAPKLYAILACLKKGPEIRFLLKKGVSDNDLPFKRKKNQSGDFELWRKSGEVIVFESWTDSNIEEFDRVQWWMMSPVFENKRHYELEDSTILPFIPFNTNSDTEQKEGGYSEVYAARIHPSHHNFWPHSELEDSEPLVAVKRLFSSNEIVFQKEVTILKALDSKENHPHLITLLATFKHQRKYHLVFRYADADLRKYWKDRPSPTFNKTTVLWSLEQMAGMAHALESLHNFPVLYPLGVDGKARLHKDTKQLAQKKEKLFGRHGDIKPENILWFQQSPESKDENGTLQLADFGLGRFHGRKSRSNVPWDEAIGSPTYEPPECKLHRPVSRAYDIWSIGCLYLEFISWLLEGSAAITDFSGTQGNTAASTAINGNHFFTIIGGAPVVREEVVVWVQQLHEHEKCSALIHELLVIIMEDLLHPESRMRAQAGWLFYRLNKCLERAAKDQDYLLKPVPLQQQKPNGYLRSRPTAIADDARRKNQKSVAFKTREKSGSFSEAKFNLQRACSAEMRELPVPGLLRRSRTHGT